MAGATDPVIITCALTGGVHGKEANPNLPEQPDEIVAQGIEAWQAGASVLHVHARLPDGTPTQDLTIFSEIHDRLCEETDAIVQLTTGGNPSIPVAERLRAVELEPEMASLNMGLLNFFIRGEQVFFPNHRSDILAFAREMVSRDVRPELEIYSSAMIEEVRYLLQQEILTAPYVLNFVLHTPTQGGEPGTPEYLVELLRRARALPVDPEDLRINVSSMGRTQLPITTIALAMGLNVRTGMEDNVMWKRGELLRDNAQLVARTARIAAELGREVATGDDARALLGTRGRLTGGVQADVGSGASNC
jgi:3-keto-5-aminohexanoate cleavage enzyme